MDEKEWFEWFGWVLKYQNENKKEIHIDTIINKMHKQISATDNCMYTPGIYPKYLLSCLC